MIFILEGCDAVGKSTLAKRLSEKLNLEVYHGSSFEASKSDNETLYNSFAKFIDMDNIIIDRFCYSNRVYATLYKDYSIVSEEQVKQLEDSLRNKAVIIYLHTDSETIKERIGKRGDDYVKSGMIDSILDEYEKVLSKANLAKLKFDTGEKTTEYIVERLVKLYNI